MQNSAEVTPVFTLVAEELLSEGRISEAIALCARGVAAFPRYSTGWLIAAKAFLRAGRKQEALEACAKGLEFAPASAALLQLHDSLAQNEVGEAGPTEADDKVSGDTSLADLARRLETAAIPPIDPSAPLPLEPPPSESEPFVSDTLATIYEQQGAYGEAIQAYALLAEHSPSRRETYSQKIAALKEKMNAAKK